MPIWMKLLKNNRFVSALDFGNKLGMHDQDIALGNN